MNYIENLDRRLNLMPGQLSIMTPQQQLEMCKLAAKLAIDELRSYEPQFDELPNELSASQIAKFLGKTTVTISKYKNQGIIRFRSREGNRHDYALKREFIDDCRTHKLI